MSTNTVSIAPPTAATSPPTLPPITYSKKLLSSWERIDTRMFLFGVLAGLFVPLLSTLVFALGSYSFFKNMTSKQKLSFLSGSLVFPDPLVIIVLNHMYFANIIPLVVYGIVVICMLVVTIPSIVVLDRKLRRLHDADTVNKAAVVVADEAVNNV